MHDASIARLASLRALGLAAVGSLLLGGCAPSTESAPDADQAGQDGGGPSSRPGDAPGSEDSGAGEDGAGDDSQDGGADASDVKDAGPDGGPSEQPDGGPSEQPDGGAPSTGKLTWAPPSGWQTFTLKTLAPGGNSFDNDKDYRVVIPNGHITSSGAIGINGGRNLVFVQPDGAGGYKLGGRITILGDNSKDTPAIQVNAHWDSSQPAAVEHIIHVEGVLFDGAGLNDVVAGGREGCVLQFENSHAVQTHGSYETAHADFLQSYRGWKEIRLDTLTGTLGYQGLFLVREMGPTPGPIYIRNVNFRSGGAGTAYAFWVTSTGTRRVQIDGDTFKVQPGRHTFPKTVWPDIDATGASKPVIAGTSPKQSATWPNLTNSIDGGKIVLNWDGTAPGKVSQFDPATDTDYCPASVPGPSYKSPGYGATKPTYNP